MALDFRGMEVGLQPADTAFRSTQQASDVLSELPHGDTGQCRRRLEDSLTSCTSSECEVRPKTAKANTCSTKVKGERLSKV